MRYLEIDTGPVIAREKISWWEQLLRWVVPAASPDLEPYFGKVRVWWLEIEDNGEPLREIGFDENGDAIVLGPVEGNYGLLLDASDDWSDSTEDSFNAAEEFDRVWITLWPKFEELDRHNRVKDGHATSSDR